MNAMKKILWALGVFLALLLLAFALFRHPDKSLEELVPLYTDAQSQWTDIDGMKVHYKTEGSGPPVILIHGTGASLHTWDGWTESLEDSFTVYRMDLPAFGLTGPHPERDYSLQMYTGFIDRFSELMKLDSFHIAGNSLGGLIAWAYTIDHPSLVHSLILVDAAGYPHEGPSSALAFRMAKNPIFRPLLKQITPKSFIRKNLEQVYGDDGKITDELVTRYHDMALRDGNRQAFIDRVFVKHQDLSPRIPEIECPTLILWGKEDTWADPGDADKFKNDIRNAHLIWYDNAGHVPMEEIPHKSAADVLHFLISQKS